MNRKEQATPSHLHRSATRALLCLLCTSVLMAMTPAKPQKGKGKRQQKTTTTTDVAQKKRVYLIHSDDLTFDKWRNNDAQVLRGNVEFEHDGARLLCDSANFYEQDNSFEAFGHVRMLQGDTLSLTSDYGFYDGNDQLMQAFQNVVLRHKKTTLYTDSLFYDRIYQMGYYEEGGKLVDGSTTLTSDWGEYHADTKTAVFNYDVRMHDRQFDLVTDSLFYFTDTKLAQIVGPSDIYSGDSHIYSERGYYNTQTEQARLLNRSVLDNKGSILIADSIWHDGISGISEAFRNVVYNDTVNKNMLTSEYAFHNDSTGYAMTTDRAVAVDYSQGDSLFMHADTIKVFTHNINTDSVYRKVHCYNRVRAYRTDVQAVCDSLVYNQQDSSMTMYRDPIVWNENQQLFGEVIKVFMKDSVIDHAHVINQAFSIEKLPEDKLFNQVSSHEMFAFFEKGQMHEGRAKDNVLVVFYPKDDSDSTFVGLVYMETSELRMFMTNRKLDRIWAPKSNGNMYPMSQIPPKKRFLEGFYWFDYVRPLNKQDIFNWRPKKSGTELKEIKRREMPLPSLDIPDETGIEPTQSENDSEQPENTSAQPENDSEQPENTSVQPENDSEQPENISHE